MRQGNPLGTLLFALMLQRPFLELQRLAQSVRPLACADDTFLQGSALDVQAAFRTLCMLAAPLGLWVVLQNEQSTPKTLLPRPLSLRRSVSGMRKTGYSLPARLLAHRILFLPFPCTSAWTRRGAS
jgi:hypothetical protein